MENKLTFIFVVGLMCAFYSFDPNDLSISVILGLAGVGAAFIIVIIWHFLCHALFLVQLLRSTRKMQ